MLVRVLCLSVLLLLAGCDWFEGKSSPPRPPANPPAATAPTISTQPAAASVTVGQAPTFTVAASGTAPFTYQWRRNGVDIAGATNASYTAPAVAMGDNGASYTAVVTNSAGSVTSAAAVLTVTQPAGTVASVKVEQNTAFLTAVGQTRLLAAGPVDANGAPVAGAVTWTSSNPTGISVDATGRVTAHAIGSAMIFAEANGVRSLPIFVVAAEPVPGALVLRDEQVLSVGSPLNLAANQVPSAGTRYEVTASGITTPPAAGTVVLSDGDSPVAGKVVSTRAESGNLVLLLEVVPLPDVLARYHLDWDIDLRSFPVARIEINETVAPPAKGVLHERAWKAGGFERFKCEGEFGPGMVTTSISLGPELGARLIIQSYRDDPTLPPDYGKLQLIGSQSLVGSASIKLQPRFGAAVECLAQARVEIPVGGFLAVLVMPALRMGVGFELTGELSIVTAELGMTGKVGLQESLGLECTNQIATGCRSLNDVSLISDFKLTKKIPDGIGLRVELEGQLFAQAAIDAVFGLGLFDAEIVKARVGPKQTFDLEFVEDQVHDSGFASTYKLDIDGAILPGSAIGAAIKKLIGDDNVSLNFGIPFSRPIAASPKGTFSVSSESIAFGRPVAFQIHLDQPVTYPFLGAGGAEGYNVENIVILRKKVSDLRYENWKVFDAPGDGQTTFQHEWTPTSDDQGDWEFAALVNTKLPVPALEITENSLRHLHVRGPGWSGNVTVTMNGSETTTDNGGGGEGGTGSTTITYTTNANGTMQLEPIEASGGAILRVVQATGTMSRGRVSNTDRRYRSNGCDISLTQTEEEFVSGNLRALEGSIAILTVEANGTYQLVIPGLQAQAHGTSRLQASESHSGGESCNDPAPTDVTTTLDETLTMSTLTMSGVVGENPRAITGTGTITVEGLPNEVYNGSWNLQQ
jgi:hypothetical protein